MLARSLFILPLAALIGCVGPLELADAHDADAGGSSENEGGAPGTDDEVLAQYARDICGQWKGMLPLDPRLTLTATFTPDLAKPRAGTISMECAKCDEMAAMAGYQELKSFDGKYNLYELDDGKAHGVFDPDQDFVLPATPIFTFYPNAAIRRIEWGLLATMRPVPDSCPLDL